VACVACPTSCPPSATISQEHAQQQQQQRRVSHARPALSVWRVSTSPLLCVAARTSAPIPLASLALCAPQASMHLLPVLPQATACAQLFARQPATVVSISQHHALPLLMLCEVFVLHAPWVLFFLSSPCTTSSNAVCQGCNTCTATQYETTACTVCTANQYASIAQTVPPAQRANT
jgi:hypothetical protein